MSESLCLFPPLRNITESLLTVSYLGGLGTKEETLVPALTI